LTATAHTAIYTLSLHDALPIYMHKHLPTRTGKSCGGSAERNLTSSRLQMEARKEITLKRQTILACLFCVAMLLPVAEAANQTYGDRKSTRLNSSHVAISYAVFC